MTGVNDDDVTDLLRANAALQCELDELRAERDAALAYQTATSEVMRVISRSTFDLRAVLSMVAKTAARLCLADQAAIMRDEGDARRLVANFGFPPEYEAWWKEAELVPHDAYPATVGVRASRERRAVHLHDVATISDYPDVAIKLGKQRTSLGVPLLREGESVGAIVLARQRVDPFTDRQIDLVRAFADQVMIAIENTRRLTETREALEQQAAAAEVLQVINSSRGDLAPVFCAMLEKAAHLCEAGFGILWTYDGKRFSAAALHGVPSAFAKFARNPISVADSAALGDIARGHEFVHVTDLATSENYPDSPLRRATVDLGGARTGLAVPLRKDGSILGVFVIYRQEVRPFSDKQIALLRNFAVQAVIAIENARLITETHEMLEQQTASAEILQVINSSPGDLAPVFSAMLDRATSLCGGAFGILWTRECERFRPVALHGVPQAFADYLASEPTHPAEPGTGLGRIAAGEPLVHLVDPAATEAYRTGASVLRRAFVDLGGTRTLLTVALRKDDALLGALSIYRREVQPFTDKKITLLQNFAAEAVIAMENARLVNEIRQRQAELRTTFDNMGDGVAMFDGEQRLAAWNRNFEHIIDLPDTLLAERPRYADYLRILVERGEFGATEAELSRWIEDIDHELRLERVRPDGRVIEVRRNAVPGGGFVLIYADITERKRSEEEIRAARDAAEAALRELKAAQASLIQAEKMASLGQLTAGIAHEIKNPLNFVNNFASLSVDLLAELKNTAAPGLATLPEDRRADIEEVSSLLTSNLQKIVEHGRRADGIVKNMLQHSRGVSGERRTVDLNTLVDEALNLAYHGARAQDQSFNIALERDFGAGIAPIELAPQEMTRVFLNLFGNGFYAIRKRQQSGAEPGLQPTLKVTTRDLGDEVEIRVRDNGTGIPDDIRDKLFQPFFTTKPTGEGTGLGLSISYDIVTQQHGGSITVDSKVGEYSEFTIRLPRNP